MKPSAVAAALGIAESTVRKYAQAYAEFLTPSGAGGQHRHRDFAEHDVKVLKLIRDMSADGTSADDMAVTLQSLASGNWERLPALEESARGIVATPGALIEANRRTDVLQREIELLRDERNRLEAARVADREALAADAKKEIAERDSRILELARQLARAELRIELLQSGDLKPKG